MFSANFVSQFCCVEVTYMQGCFLQISCLSFCCVEVDSFPLHHQGVWLSVELFFFFSVICLLPFCYLSIKSFSSFNLVHSPVFWQLWWPSDKAFTSRVGDLGIEPRWSHTSDLDTLVLSRQPCQASSILGSVQGLVIPVLVCCDWVRRQVLLLLLRSISRA